MDGMGSDTWTGPATLDINGRGHAVEVRLSGRFEPVEGRYRWAGRTSDGAVTAAFQAGARAVTVRIGDGPSRTARLGDPDPWGGIRITGIGRPPWPGEDEPPAGAG
jgi:hypothetical protein